MCFMQMIMKDVKIMTFDEAETKVENLVGDLNIPLGVEGTLLDVIDKLREEYAPTVEMTQEQVNVIDSFKKNFSASYLPEVIHNQPEGDWSFLDELSGKLFGHRQGGMTDKNIEDIMRIWLHPETIKVVDE